MVNYNNSIIYKLCCKDVEVKDIYVGSTTNFKARKCYHKSTCNNENDKSYNIKVYKFIRDNGNWDNWDMVIIEQVSCSNKLELHKQERKYIEDLKSSLNCFIPTRPHKEYREANKDKIKEHSKQYRQDNKEKERIRHKKYYNNNKDKIKEYVEKNKYKLKEYNKEYRENNKVSLFIKNKSYRDNNKVQIKEKKKEYYQNNKGQILEQQKALYTCVCGTISTKSHKARHERTKKHIDFINNN